MDSMPYLSRLIYHTPNSPQKGLHSRCLNLRCATPEHCRQNQRWICCTQMALLLPPYFQILLPGKIPFDRSNAALIAEKQRTFQNYHLRIQNQSNYWEVKHPDQQYLPAYKMADYTCMYRRNIL